MILYLDTSSLVKLYVQERGSAEIHRMAEQAELVTTSVVAYAEARGVGAQAARAQPDSARVQGR